MPFVHLHVHTEYSMLDGLTRVRDLFDTARTQGAPAVAITDHGTLGAMWQAKQNADRTGVKLIPGLEAYIAIGSRFTREKITVPADSAASEGDDEKEKATASSKQRVYEHLTILARNRAGWTNLVRLQNESSKHVAGRAKLIDYELLKEHGDGLMVLTGCIGGPVFGPISRAAAALASMDAAAEEADRAAAAEQYESEMGRARTNLEKLIDAVGREHVFVEVMDHGNEDERQSLPLLRDLADEYGLPLVATNDTHHTAEHERVAHDAWLAVQTKSTLAAPKFQFHGHGYHLRDAAEMTAVYPAYCDPRAMTVARAMAAQFITNLGAGIPEDLLPQFTLESPNLVTAEQRTHIEAVAGAAAVHQVADLQERIWAALHRAPKWWSEACQNTLAVADLVDEHVLPDRLVRLPQFPVPEGFDGSLPFMQHLIAEGISSRYPAGASDSVTARIETEMRTIVEMGFVDYFLIVWDFINWAQRNGKLVGPGRGSGAGSIVAYLMGITQVDPLEYHLLFERFLEPGRAELPDFDIDFESRHKQDIIQYLAERWGEDCVAQIGNVGKPKVRGSFKSAMRVLAKAPSLTDRLSKMIPDDMSAKELLESQGGGDQRLRDFWSAAEKVDHIDHVLDLTLAFFDTAQHSGIHASGVIISPEPLTDLIPMRWMKPGSSDRYRWVAEWDHRDIENFGLVKFDVLAIRNLDMAHVAMDFINDTTGDHLTLDTIPHPDRDAQNPGVKRAFEMLQNGRTAGVFQLEGDAMTRLLEEVGPQTLEELCAVIALFRPGPLSAGMHTKYALRKQGREQVTYDYLTSDPNEAAWLNTVMGETFGIYIYQEQVMALGRVISGFDDVWRSKLRKAVSKKNAVLMEEVGGKFIEGAGQEFRDENGTVISPVFSAATAQRVWEAMQGSAEYLFNKSHSLCYALIAFHTAYLKANYPAHYGAATLSVTGPEKRDKRIAAMNALIDEGMRILAPDVNTSGMFTRPSRTGEEVLLGLEEVKGVGAVAEDIIRERDRAGEFSSLMNLIDRVTVGEERRQLPMDRLEALIDCGACDRFGPRLGMKMVCRVAGQEGIEIPAVEYSTVELGARQASRLLMILDGHVRSHLQSVFESWTMPVSNTGFDAPRAIPVSELESRGYQDGAVVLVSGLLASYSEKPYSRGVMGRVEIEDVTESISGVMWNEERAKVKDREAIPPVSFPVVLQGKLETRTFTVRSDDEDGGEDKEVSRRELNIQNMFPIPVSLQPSGVLPADPFPMIDFTAVSGIIRADEYPAPTLPGLEFGDGDCGGGELISAPAMPGQPSGPGGPGAKSFAPVLVDASGNVAVAQAVQAPAPAAQPAALSPAGQVAFIDPWVPEDVASVIPTPLLDTTPAVFTAFESELAPAQVRVVEVAPEMPTLIPVAGTAEVDPVDVFGVDDVFEAIVHGSPRAPAASPVQARTDVPNDAPAGKFALDDLWGDIS